MDSFAFKNFYQKVPFHFLGIADFECMNETLSNKSFADKKTNIIVQKDISSALAIFSESKNSFKNSYQQNFGHFCVKDYLRIIKTLEEEIRVIFGRSIKMNKNEQDEECFKTAESCCMC